VRLAEVHDVEPVARVAFAVVWRRQQTLDQPFVRFLAAIRDERVDLRRRRRQQSRSCDSRRISVGRSASGDGARPAACRRSITNASIGVRTRSEPVLATAAARSGRSAQPSVVGSAWAEAGDSASANSVVDATRRCMERARG
jgi:hypothetical protein